MFFSFSLPTISKWKPAVSFVEEQIERTARAMRVAATAALAVVSLNLAGGVSFGQGWQLIMDVYRPGNKVLTVGDYLSGYGAAGSVSSSGTAVSGAGGALCKYYDMFSSTNSYALSVGTGGSRRRVYIYTGAGSGEAEGLVWAQASVDANVFSGEGSAAAFAKVQAKVEFDSGSIEATANATTSVSTSATIGVVLSLPGGSLPIAGTVSGGGPGHYDTFDMAGLDKCTNFVAVTESAEGSVAVNASQTITGPGHSKVEATLNGRNGGLVILGHCPY